MGYNQGMEIEQPFLDAGPMEWDPLKTNSGQWVQTASRDGCLYQVWKDAYGSGYWHLMYQERQSKEWSHPVCNNFQTEEKAKHWADFLATF